MTPQAYRASHTTLALTGNWRHIYSEKPVKQSKVNVFEVDQFCRDSPASAFLFRLCPQCRDDDLHSHAMTYWHRAHHIAGIDICPKHGIALQAFEWQDAYTTPNPATLCGQVSHHALIQANFHPILTRYREIALAALRAPAQVQYARAHDQLLERATNMGLCRRELHHTGTRYYLKHAIPQYLYTHLPRVWMEEHFNSAFLDSTFIPSDTSKDEYHAELNRLDHSDSSKPIFLFLALATLFESSDQICTILFDRKVRTLLPSNCADEGLR